MIADLHIHTTASDGRLSPAETINAAINAGLTCIAITDHDTVAGIKELNSSCPSYAKSLSVIPGIELNTDLPTHEVHILGYFIDIDNAELLSELESILRGRRQRALRMVEILNQLGYAVQYERVKEIAGQSVAIGRPHIAKALLEKGYFGTTQDVFTALLEKNAPAYVPHYKLNPAKAIQLIKKAGGIPVLAHPGLIGDDMVVKEMMTAGIQGLEVYHPKHDSVTTQKYLNLALRSKLLVTGGSDFHGIPGRLPEELGTFSIPLQLAQILQSRIQA
ncbi:Hypothetical protein LUCI_1213 [Lucifera butyrica]|uniref:Polymerase/histidinol phosphatase N-terminal domain-containing protein n=1 Tax=Lucifera butyrica TaxID=1351585 RepID=A0A498R6V6_9FIRM|nr:PHP domain-containing protein [Lucifera butyrica]VBB06002.1 Hypothetical protein LUCI_1213 [Lucifera butyrica]